MGLDKSKKGWKFRKIFKFEVGVWPHCDRFDMSQYGQNQSEKKLGVGEKYHQSTYLGGPESAG